MAQLLTQLAQPEQGWTRFDDTHALISKVGYTSSSSGSPYGGSYSYIQDATGKPITFSFIGSKIRIIGRYYNVDYYGQAINLVIDGQIKATFSQRSTSNVMMCLLADVSGLNYGYHEATIQLADTGNTNFGINLDAVDLDGYLVDKRDLGEVFSLEDVTIGKRIRCHYESKVGSMGVFSKLGTSTDALIPEGSSSTPSGDFYFVGVEDGESQLKLIPDRVLQHSIAAATIEQLISPNILMQELYCIDRDNLTNLFRFNEPSGNVMDTVSTVYGTLSNATRVPGYIGNGVAFTSGVRGYVDFSARLLQAGPKSVIIRFKTSQVPPVGKYSILLDTCGFNTSYRGVTLCIDSGGKLGVAINGGSSSNSFYTQSNATVTTGEWVTAKVTWTGDSTVEGFKIFIDDMNNPDLESTCAVAESTSYSYAYNCRLGSNNSNVRSNVIQFEGYIDLLEVYKGALPHANIRYLALEGGVYKRFAPGGTTSIGEWLDVSASPTSTEWLNDGMTKGELDSAKDVGGFNLLSAGSKIITWSDESTFNPFAVYINPDQSLTGSDSQQSDASRVNIYLRQMTGGKSAFDIYSEWDTNVSQAVYDGYSQGDDTLWHWSAVSTITATSPENSDTKRVTRGVLSVDNRDSVELSAAGATHGFRPILVVNKGEYSKESLGALYEVESGLLFVDDFTSLNSRWTLSPTGGYSITERPSHMRLKHMTASDTLMLASIPSGEFAFEVIADYTPMVEGDEGGILLWNNASDTLEFLEAVDPNHVPTQSNWMAVLEEGEWLLYSDSGSGYDFVDTSKIEANRFGVVLKRGNGTGYAPLDIDMIIATKGDKISVLDVEDGYTVRIKDIDGNILVETLSENYKASLKLPYLEVEGTIEVVLPNGNVTNSLSGVFHGGDIYSVGAIIQLRQHGIELNRNAQNGLGDAKDGSLVTILEVHNPHTTSISNVELSIAQYSASLGWQWADLSLDVVSASPVYSDTIFLSELPGKASVPFKLSIQAGMSNRHEIMEFSIDIKHD